MEPNAPAPTTPPSVPSTATPDRTGCVHCHAPLQLREHEAIHVLTCPAQHGLFLHADALQHSLENRTEDRPEAEEQAAEQAQGSRSVEALVAEEGVRTCPTCGVDMAKQVFAYQSGVPIDVCGEHGIWLDAGELQQLEAWYEAQERHRAADREVWGGADGKLEQIEEQHERAAADDLRAVHWGPVGSFLSSASWWWQRRDDR